MRELGFGCVLLGVALLAFPLYDQFLPFLHLPRMYAQLAGAGLLVGGGSMMLLTTR